MDRRGVGVTWCELELGMLPQKRADSWWRYPEIAGGVLSFWASFTTQKSLARWWAGLLCLLLRDWHLLPSSSQCDSSSAHPSLSFFGYSLLLHLFSARLSRSSFWILICHSMLLSWSLPLVSFFPFPFLVPVSTCSSLQTCLERSGFVALGYRDVEHVHFFRNMLKSTQEQKRDGSMVGYLLEMMHVHFGQC